MPKQFAPLALGAVVAEKVLTQGVHERRAVAWTPVAPGVPNIIMLVDESIRPDYLDLTPGNQSTPHLAALAPKFVNFGPAVSGGDCSHYSNAILRFAASRRDLVTSVRSNPTLWQYAKRAGYRTVFIDAQAGVNKNPGLLQNFMSPGEKADIDGFYTITDVDSAHADYRLIDIMAEELKRPEPVFIYANKNGAHFPYDRAYPAAEALYHPSLTEAGAETVESHIASYRNAISWSVDRFMTVLFERANLSHTAMIYTSDHGQVLDPGKLSHCAVDNPDLRMGIVPLLVHTDLREWRDRFAEGARRNYGKASHFQIAPALLALMGFGAADIATEYDETLFAETLRQPAFTSGDIFGLFTDETNWTPVNPENIGIEPEALALLPKPKGS
jgi:lipid A ethanolaminephosphotransferase